MPMNPLSLDDLALRLGVALFMGLVLGYEREQHGRAAGMRTTMLVCVASAVVMMLSQYLFVVSGGGGSWRPDPARLAAGVLAGMGFLGAGVIIQQDSAIYGVTTAAVLWFSAILGMAIGAGFMALGLMGFAVVLVALFVLPGLERRIWSDRYAHLEVSAGLDGPSQEAVVAHVGRAGLAAKLRPIGLEEDRQAKRRIMLFRVKTRNHKDIEVQAGAVARVAGMKGVRKVRWY
jgi:putative Mg2+ transporter-C (MgtC) family protein